MARRPEVNEWPSLAAPCHAGRLTARDIAGLHLPQVRDLEQAARDLAAGLAH